MVGAAEKFAGSNSFRNKNPWCLIKRTITCSCKMRPLNVSTNFAETGRLGLCEDLAACGCEIRRFGCDLSHDNLPLLQHAEADDDDAEFWKA